MKFTLAAVAAACVAPYAIGATTNTPPILPAEITPPVGSNYITTLFASGTQNYVCNSTGGWVFSRPEALLFKNGANPFNRTAPAKSVGVHYFLDTPDANGGRPTWELRYLRQIVTTKAWKTLPSNSSANIAWLLTNLTSYSGPRTAPFARLGFVVRAETKLGSAVGAPPCTEGAITKQPYSALYHYYTRVGVAAPRAQRDTADESNNDDNSTGESVTDDKGADKSGTDDKGIDTSRTDDKGSGKNGSDDKGFTKRGTDDKGAGKNGADDKGTGKSGKDDKGGKSGSDDKGGEHD